MKEERKTDGKYCHADCHFYEEQRSFVEVLCAKHWVAPLKFNEKGVLRCKQCLSRQIDAGKEFES